MGPAYRNVAICTTIYLTILMDQYNMTGLYIRVFANFLTAERHLRSRDHSLLSPSNGT